MPRLNPNIDRDAPASRVAAKFGSPSKLARAIKRTPSTVQRWIDAGSIPPEYHSEIIDAGIALKIKPPLTPADFVDSRLFQKAG
jgi:hypothetical protein